MQINWTITLPISQENEGLLAILLHYNGAQRDGESLNDAISRVLADAMKEKIKSMIIPNLRDYMGAAQQTAIDGINQQLDEALSISFTID